MPAETTDLWRAFGDDVELVALEVHEDSRGRLVPIDLQAVPFDVRRAFTVSDVKAGTIRGGHAHRQAEQLLVCVAGEVEIELRRGDKHHKIELSPGTGALYLAAGVWASQRYTSDGTVLLVLASGPFDPGGYENEPSA